MKRIFKAYRDLIGIIFRESPWLVALTLGCTVLSGLLVPAGIYVNTNVLDGDRWPLGTIGYSSSSS